MHTGRSCCVSVAFFFFNDTATTEIYTLSLHDALPISILEGRAVPQRAGLAGENRHIVPRSEEHTSELQSQFHLVCRLLLEKKKVQLYPAVAGAVWGYAQASGRAARGS